MSEVKTYDFDLKRALAGDAVCDTFGDPVTQLQRFEGVANGHCLVGIRKDGDMDTYSLLGVYHVNGQKSCRDLRMVTDGVQGELVEALRALVAAQLSSSLEVVNRARTKASAALDRAGKCE